MTLSNGSASANARTLSCPSWLAFPRVNRTTEDAARGTGLHGYVRAVLAGVPQTKALACVVEEYRETARLLDWKKLCGDLEGIETECAYALDVKARTARFLGANVSREYGPLGEWEVPGSLDIKGVRQNDARIVVVDMKFGFQDVEPAQDNAQGLFFGAVLHLLTNASEVEFRVAKIKANGDVWNDVATYGAWEIDDYLDELEQAIVLGRDAQRVYIAGGTPEVTEGHHCQYCPAADACPAKTRLARAMISELTPIEDRILAMAPEEAGKAWELVHERAAPLVERIQDALKERARREPIPLSGGRVLRETSYEKESLVTASILDLARELGATDEQIKGCYRPTTIRPVKAVKNRRLAGAR